MTARKIVGEAPGGKRTPLADVLPLDTPFVVQIFPIYACNFTCKYCHCSIESEKRCFVTDQINMEMQLFQRVCDEMQHFPQKIKTLRFVGMGEPLLHKNIVAMIAYAKQKNIANTVELLTNGSLLTETMTNDLIEVGLDRMVVSIQGTCAEKYKEVSQVELDFQRFVEQLKYFYENKKNTHVYIKIADCALDDEEDKELFYDIFEDICDSIGVEHTVPIFPGVRFNDDLQESKQKISQFGVPIEYVSVCSQPFYTVQINPDGKVVGCHSIPYPKLLGDCNIESITDIWNGKEFNQFRREMLDGRHNLCKVCSDCNIMNYRIFREDDISDAALEIKEFYK